MPESRSNSRTAVVITVSTRTAAGIWEDRSGPILVSGLRDLGFHVDAPVVVADGDGVEIAIRQAVADEAACVITTGGTGLTPMDLTPEMTRRVLDREAPGISEAIRAYGTAQGVASSMLSRGVSGVAGHTLIINLPGSTGGVRDGLAVISPVLSHAIDQLGGGDHRMSDPGSRD